MLAAHKDFIAELLAQNLVMASLLTGTEVGAGILLTIMKPLETYFNTLVDHAADKLPDVDGVDYRPVYDKIRTPGVHLECVVEYLCLHTVALAGEIPVDLIRADKTRTGREIYAYVYELLSAAPALPGCDDQHYFDRSPFKFSAQLGEIFKEV